MRERLASSPGQPDALHDAVVGELVMQGEVSSAQQLADYPEVGGIAAHQGERRLGAQQLGDGCLQLAVQRTLPGGDPARLAAPPSTAPSLVWAPGVATAGPGDRAGGLLEHHMDVRPAEAERADPGPPKRIRRRCPWLRSAGDAERSE